jgi:hypothetical protein
MDSSIVAEIDQLRQLKTAALRVQYREIFGEESRSSNRQFLLRRIAWRLQAKAEGDLSERARRRALEIANDATCACARPKAFWWRQYRSRPHFLSIGRLREETCVFRFLARC